MSNYTSLAKYIIENVGGSENIISLEHCITRLRFQLKDQSLANTEKLKNKEGIVTVMKAGGQYQVVIGNKVAHVYDEICKLAKINNKSNENKDENTKKMTFGAYLIDLMASIMMPILSLMTASGILKGLIIMGTMSGVLKTETGIYTLINSIADAAFYFLPIFLGYNTAKKIGVSPYLGMLMGAILCYPSINGTDIDLLGKNINVTYTSSFLPIIFIVFIAKPIEKFLKKIVPDVVKGFMVPLLLMIILVPIGFSIIGPFANSIGEVISKFVTYLYQVSPLVMGIIIGGLWQVLVIFGMHGVLISVCMFNIFNGTGDMVLAVSIFVCFAQAAAVLAIVTKTKDKKLKNMAIPAAISCVFGVTEPSIYGITLPRMKVFVASCIGGATSGALCGVFGILKYAPGGGIFGIPTLFNGSATNLIPILITALAGIAVSFVLTLIVFKEDVKGNEEDENKVKNLSDKQNDFIFSPCEGIVKPLSECKDEAFASGLLGKGVLIEPKDGKIYAPFDGQVATLFPTKHAIGLISNNNCELLIHIGMNTVELKGKYFESHVKQGDQIQKGDLLISFDKDKILSEGYDINTPIIITNYQDENLIKYTQKNRVSIKDSILEFVGNSTLELAK